MLRRALRYLILLCMLCAAVPALAAPPDPVRFGVRVEAGDLATAQEWLKAGLDPNYEGDRVGSGMMIAAWEGNVAMMELFHRHGANVNHVNASGEQALLHAAWKGRLEAVEWLLAHGAQLNRGEREWSALHYAVFAGHEDVVRLLLERGADVNARAPNGSSVLMMAAHAGHKSLAQLLLERGADPSTRNDHYDDATDWALKYGHVQLAEAISSDEALARAARAATLAPALIESEAAPRPLAELVDALRQARAEGRSTDDVLRRYTGTLDALKNQ